jgi:hypothetical protein
MANQNQPMDTMIREIRVMRDNVALLARNETDGLSYRAYLLQARGLRSIEEAIGSLRSDASIQAMREDVVDDTHIEQFWITKVADWLENHWKAATDGVESNFEPKLPFMLSQTNNNEVGRLYVKRHHAMIADFCESNIARLRSKADELQRDLNAFANGVATAAYQRSPQV